MTVQFGIFARTFPRDTAEAVADAIANAGYAITQMNLASFGRPTIPSPEQMPNLPDVKASFDRKGVSIWGVSATYNVIDRDNPAVTRATANAGTLIRHARELGANTVTLCTGTRDTTNIWRAHPDNGLPEAWSDLRSTLEELIPAAAESGVRLGIEPEPGNVICDSAAAVRLLEELGTDARHLGIVLDPANLLTPGTLRDQQEILTAAFGDLGPYTVAVHAKDVVGEGSYAAAGHGGLEYDLIARLHLALPVQVPVIVQDTTEADAPAVRRFLESCWAKAGATNVVGTPE